MKPALAVLLLWALFLSIQDVGKDGALVTFTRRQLDAAIAQTKSENTRLEGLHQLIRMAGHRLYETSIVGGATPTLKFSSCEEMQLGPSGLAEMCLRLPKLSTVRIMVFIMGGINV